MSYTIEAGALYRRFVRRYLMKNDIPFREDKGLLDSLFVLDTNQQVVANKLPMLERWLQFVAPKEE